MMSCSWLESYYQFCTDEQVTEVLAHMSWEDRLLGFDIPNNWCRAFFWGWDFPWTCMKPCGMHTCLSFQSNDDNT